MEVEILDADDADDADEGKRDLASVQVGEGSAPSAVAVAELDYRRPEQHELRSAWPDHLSLSPSLPAALCSALIWRTNRAALGARHFGSLEKGLIFICWCIKKIVQSLHDKRTTPVHTIFNTPGMWNKHV